MKKYVITFYSPRTSIAKETCKEIECWDIKNGIEEIIRSYGTKHCGFYFIIKERKDNEVVEKRGVYNDGNMKLQNLIGMMEDMTM